MPNGENILRDIIVYLGKRTRLQKTRIQKLMYLLEAEYADKHGKRLMTHPFYHDNYGMNSFVLETKVKKLRDDTIEIRDYVVESRAGYEIKIKPGTPDPDLNPDIKAACDLILREYAPIHTVKQLATMAKRTLPFVGTPKGKMVDWSLLTDPCARGECNCELTENGRRLLIEATER